MENNEVIKYERGLIKLVSNAITITNKLLALAKPQLIPYRKGNKWGFCSPDKKIIIDCIYDDAHQFSEGLAMVEDYGDDHEGGYGFINIEGDIVIPCIYEDADDFANGLARVCLNQNDYADYGFVNKVGREIIPLIYDNDICFLEGLALVRSNNKYKLNNKYGFIDILGNLVIPHIYDFASDFSEGLAKAIKGGAGYIDKKENLLYHLFMMMDLISQKELPASS